jgi:hypothetical protein
MISFVRSSPRGDEHVEGPEDGVAAVARDLDDLLQLSAQHLEALRVLGPRDRLELGTRQREEHSAMRHERPAQAPDLLPELDQPADLALGVVGVVLHCPLVELLERELDRLELVEVGLEHPSEQVGEELHAIEAADVARGRRHALAKVVEDLDRRLVDRDDPPSGHEAVHLHALGLPVSPNRRERRHVQVRVEVAEVRARVAVHQSRPTRGTEIERVDGLLDLGAVGAVEVDPEDGLATQIVDVVGPVLDLVDLVTVEQQGGRHAVGIPARIVE